jgi:alkane 1-monooxygenase
MVVTFVRRIDDDLAHGASRPRATNLINRMKLRDLKYLFAYLLPASAFMALAGLGPWSWATVLLAFVILPLFEWILPSSTLNIPAEEEPLESGRLWFDGLLYLNAPLLFAITGIYLTVLTQASLTMFELTGLTLSVGIIVGACGINVAHELGHRSNKMEQALSKLMLLPALYQHFFIEHNRGHHKHVATPLDPATARYGEWLFPFWFRSVWGGWRNAWKLETERLEKSGQPVLSWHNEMLRFQVFQLLWLGGIFMLFSWQGLLGAVAIAVVGFLLLETINYVEHYGLQRRILPSGRPEPVRPAHSWNSDHEMGRIFLYELTRHSDHHYKASRKYQILRHMDESPQLPAGYPASVILALVPPLWFWVMHRRLREEREGKGGE